MTCTKKAVTNKKYTVTIIVLFYEKDV